MAITTRDQLLAGMRPPVGFHKASFTGEAAGQYHNLGAIAGLPGAMTLGSPGLNGVNVTGINSLGGALPWVNPVSGNAYLAKLALGLGLNIIGFMIFDLLWYNTGINVTTTTIQGITTGNFPSRDRDGANLGNGVELWFFASSTLGNAGVIANTTINYTNQAGTTGRTAGLIPQAPATVLLNTMVPFGLQGNDTGIQAITSASGGGITLGTTYTSGTISLLAIRRILEVYLPVTPAGSMYDAFDLGMPQVYNDSNLYMAVLLSGTAGGITVGNLSYSHG